MRTMILTIMLLLGVAAVVSARDPETVTIRGGQQKKAGSSGITIKFVSVVEDSRPPEGTMGIWAGNAKIEILITDRRGSKTAYVNTNMGPHGDQYGGYAINLESLTPLPSDRTKLSVASYRATFSIERLHR